MKVLTIDQRAEVVVFTLEDPYRQVAPDELTHLLRRLHREFQAALPDKLVLVLAPGVRLEALRPEDMERYGWVRK